MSYTLLQLFTICNLFIKIAFYVKVFYFLYNIGYYNESLHNSVFVLISLCNTVCVRYIMQARRASRELAFILLSQFDKKVEKYSKENLDDMIVKSIRLLLSSASDDLKLSLGVLNDMKNRIDIIKQLLANNDTSNTELLENKDI